MSKCERCKVEIRDASMICPLCRGVIAIEEKGNGENGKSENVNGGKMYDSHSLMYPDVSPAIRRIKFVIKLVLFLSVLAEGILILINYLTYNGLKWSLISGAALAYLCFTVIYSFQRYNGYRRKIMWQMFGAMILAVLIDLVLGFRGWSLSFGIPCVIMAIDVVIFVLMLVNKKGFQEYLMMQIYNFVFGALYLIAILVFALTDFFLLAIIAAGVSGVMLLGTLVFGDKAAAGELSRRFRI